MGQQSGFVRKFVRLCVFLFLIGGSTAWGQLRPRVVQAVNNDQRITLKGNVHPLARAEFDRGAVVESQPMTRMLLLLKRGDDQEAALQQYLDSQQDKSSPNYHAWLTPEGFGANYGPADADVQAVTDWLANQGFTVAKVYSSKTVIEFSGTVGAVESTFGTAIRNFEIGGKTYMANASDPQIPAALAPVVAGIVSLNNFPRPSHARIVGQARKVAGKPGLEPLLTFPFGNGTFYGMSPGDFATIYNTAPLLTGNPKIDGTGQTIAIVGETNIHVSDVQAFRTMFGLPANFDATNVILNGEDPGITSQGEEGEADLDVEWSGAVAPGATVKFVVSASTPASAGIDLSALYIVEHNLAGAMSESYGGCESGLGTINAFYNSLWQQAAAQGITVMVSTGDNGSAGCDDFNTATAASQGLAVNGLASTPYNVAVGGTDFDEVNKWSTFWSATNSVTETSALSYIPEIPWNESCAQIGLTGCGANAPQGSLNIVAGSGGPSSTYSKPNWQLGVTGMPNDSHRDLPDVSLFASSGFNGTGYIYCQSDQTITGAAMCDINNINDGGLDFGIVGGTSASSPALAGIMALVNQYEANNGGTDRQGNANDVLYALAKKTGAGVFNDVTKGNSVLPTGGVGVGTNSVPCQGGTLNCSSAVASANGVLVDPANAKTEAWTAGVGYDMATGLGSVNVNNLASQWKTANATKTTTTLTLSPMTGITHGTTENVGVKITVTPTSAAGSVSLIAKFTDGTTQGLDQFTLASGKVLNGTTNSLPGGTYSVTAHYAGDGTNAPSDSAAANVTVAPENSKTFIVVPSFDASGNLLNGNATSVQYGSNYIIRMYVTDKNGVASAVGPPSPTCATENAWTCPSGTVTLTDSGTAVGTGGGGAGIYNLNSQGYTRNLSPNLTGGTHTLLASYSGDASYQASNSGPLSFTVTPSPMSISEQLPGNNPIAGTAFQVSVTGYSQALTGVASTGTVTFYDGATQMGSPVAISGNPGGYQPSFFANASFTIATAGSHTLTANYSGDANYAASSTSTTFNVLFPTSASVTVSPTTVNYGSTVTMTGVINTTASASRGAPKPTGTVSVYAGYDGQITNQASSTVTTDASGNWEIQVTATIMPSNTEGFSIGYNGDSNYASVSASSSLVTVNIPDFSLGPASGISVVPVAGQAGSGQITITPLSQTPSTVTLSFSNLVISGYNIALSPQQVGLNGSPATATISMTPVGTTPSNGIRSQARHAGLLAVKRGNWWLLSLATGLCALFLLGHSDRRRKFRAALGLSVVCLLCFAISCGGGGGGGGNGGGGGGGGGGSTPQATTITLTTSNPKAAQNAPFLITATVSGKQPLTGIVTFYNFGVAFAGGVPPTNGQAQTGQGYLNNPGLYQVTATYSGDTNNLPSTSAPLTQVITGTMPVTIQGNTGGDVHSMQVSLGVQ
jgi:subtilase family serine protease